MKFKMFYVTLLIASCLFNSASNPAIFAAKHAASEVPFERPWFEIEILLFEQSTEERLSAEKWDQIPSLIDTSRSQDFLTLDASQVPLKEICLNGQLIDVESALEFSVVEIETEIAVVSPKSQVIGGSDQLAPTITADSNSDNLDATRLSKQNERAIAILELEEEQPFVVLEHQFNQLNELETSLRRRRGVRYLQHITWRQPVQSKQDSKPIRIYTGKNYSEKFNPEGDVRIEISSYEQSEADNSLLTTEDNFSALETQSIDNEFNQYSLQQTLTDGSSYPRIQTPQEIRQQQLNSCQFLIEKRAEQRHQDVWQIDGNIRIYVERYLHLETDLMLRIPGEIEVQLGAIQTGLQADKLLTSIYDESTDDANPIDNSDDDFGWQLGDNFLDEDQNTSVQIQEILNKYSMQQSRRMRSKETHYIDHPLFGMLIQIRPYDIDSAREAAIEALKNSQLNETGSSSGQ